MKVVIMSYIIVSDVHLGSELCNHSQFCHFLEWIKDLNVRTETVKCRDKDITITRPDKLILLGDILELWDPLEGDRNYVVKQGLRPFSLLSDIDCDKIFVVGNHDDSISDYENMIDCEMLANSSKIDIYNRHYPEQGTLAIGERTYFFLHGHQFDKEQAILAWVSNLLGEKWDPIKWFQDLFNITFTKSHWKKSLVVFMILLVTGWYFWEEALRTNFLHMLIWALVTGFFALSSVPGLVTRAQRRIYDFNKPKDKTAQQIIENGFYQSHKDTVSSNVVVFGHTHFASSYKEGQSGGKLFLNSGCWIGSDNDIDGKRRYANTFIYIDESGEYILKWLDGKVNCIEAFPVRP